MKQMDSFQRPIQFVSNVIDPCIDFCYHKIAYSPLDCLKGTDFPLLIRDVATSVL